MLKKRHTYLRRSMLAASASVIVAAGGVGAVGVATASTQANANDSHSGLVSHGLTARQAPLPRVHQLARGSQTAAQAALYREMHLLWDQHMEWTYGTVAAFEASVKTKAGALTPTLTRLLEDQTGLGNSLKPYYGGAAGNEFSKLLHTHILDYVPVLEAAAKGDSAAADAAFAKVLANGVQIAHFMARLNPNWPAAQMVSMWNTHNKQTLAYAADQLEGNYAASIAGYNRAEAHMWKMADMMATGIIKQFPNKVSAQASAAYVSRATQTAAQAALYQRMYLLWAQHMEWTYGTIAAFHQEPTALTATLTRLLKDQTDLGNSLKPYYGTAAGNKFSALLHAHILSYVPVLEAAAAGKTATVKADFAKTLANGAQIAKFMAKLNPNWPEARMVAMWNTHNEETLQYAADQLEGHYTASIAEYGKAEQHMWKMADMMAAGIIKQLPQKVNS